MPCAATNPPGIRYESDSSLQRKYSYFQYDLLRLHHPKSSHVTKATHATHTSHASHTAHPTHTSAAASHPSHTSLSTDAFHFVAQNAVATREAFVGRRNQGLDRTALSKRHRSCCAEVFASRRIPFLVEVCHSDARVGLEKTQLVFKSEKKEIWLTVFF